MKKDSLGEATGELSTGVGVKPANVLTQYSAIESPPNLVDLSFCYVLKQQRLETADY